MCEAEGWKEALAGELAALDLGRLEPLRGPVLAAAGQMALTSASALPGRVALAFGSSCEAADAVSDEATTHGSAVVLLGERFWELAAVCVLARASLTALGAERPPRAVSAAVRARMREASERLRDRGSLLSCAPEPGPQLIAHVGGLLGPLTVGATLIAGACWESSSSEPYRGADRLQFVEGERLVSAALRGLGDHAIDGALALERATEPHQRFVSLWREGRERRGPA